MRKSVNSVVARTASFQDFFVTLTPAIIKMKCSHSLPQSPLTQALFPDASNTLAFLLREYLSLTSRVTPLHFPPVFEIMFNHLVNFNR